MKKELLINVSVVVIIIVIFVVIAGIIRVFSKGNQNTFKYKGDNYVLLEFNESIFTYNYNGNQYLEVEEIHELKHDKWKVIYQEGDLLFLDKDIKNAIKYYTNDNNYDWFVVFDSGETELKKYISISEDELNSLYKIYNTDMEETILFDDIELFADVLKVSKDGFIQGVTTLALVEGNWYYKTEVMTEETREYVIPVAESLNQKINDLLKE